VVFEYYCVIVRVVIWWRAFSCICSTSDFRVVFISFGILSSPPISMVGDCAPGFSMVTVGGMRHISCDAFPIFTEQQASMDHYLAGSHSPHVRNLDVDAVALGAIAASTLGDVHFVFQVFDTVLFDLFDMPRREDDLVFFPCSCCGVVLLGVDCIR